MALTVGRGRGRGHIASAESFSRAADELHVAQSAVSRQVGLLERELGITLLHRTTHDVALTDAGRHLLERGESLARDADALWEDMRAFAAGERGRVRVGYSTSIGYETAPRLIGVAREALPDVDVTSVVLPSLHDPAANPRHHALIVQACRDAGFEPRLMPALPRSIRATRRSRRARRSRSWASPLATGCRRR
jgi:DNA-binding transcriptional LysR family regulator